MFANILICSPTSFGGQIGYNWHSGNWPAGIERDFDGAIINGVNHLIVPDVGLVPGDINGFMPRENIGWLASIRGRLGVTSGSPTFLFGLCPRMMLLWGRIEESRAETGCHRLFQPIWIKLLRILKHFR